MLEKLIERLGWANLANESKEIFKLMNAAIEATLSDAPVDGNTYGRKDGTWEEITGGGGGIESVSGDAVDNTDPLNPIINLPTAGVLTVTGEAVDNNDPLNPIINGVAEVSGSAVNNTDPKYPVINKQDLQSVLTEGAITDKSILMKDALVGTVDYNDIQPGFIKALKNVGNFVPDGFVLTALGLSQLDDVGLYEYTFPKYNGEVRVVNYKIYTAQLVQTGTGDPIPTVLENTLGFTPTFLRVTDGYYTIVENVATNPEKVATFITESTNNTGAGTSVKAGFESQFEGFIITTTVTGTGTDGLLSDAGGFKPTILEIRVYN